MENKERPKWNSREGNTVFDGEHGKQNFKGCLLFIALIIITLLCIYINEPEFFFQK